MLLHCYGLRLLGKFALPYTKVLDEKLEKHLSSRDFIYRHFLTRTRHCSKQQSTLAQRRSATLVGRLARAC